MNDAVHELPLFPEDARSWLLSSGRAEEWVDTLVAIEADDHLTLAGIQIASGNGPQLLSEVYVSISPNVTEITPQIIANIASIAVRDAR